MFDHVHGRLEPQIDETWISGSHDYGSGAKVLPDRPNGPKGPLAGIYSAWLHGSENVNISGFVTVPIDGPCLSVDLYERMSNDDKFCVAYDGKQLHPTFAYWAKQDLKIYFEQDKWSEDASLMRLAKGTQAKPVMIDDPNALLNINAKADLMIAKVTI